MSTRQDTAAISRVLRSHRQWLIRQEVAAARKAAAEVEPLRRRLQAATLSAAQASATRDAAQAILERQLLLRDLDSFLSNAAEYRRLKIAADAYGNAYYRQAVREIDAARVQVMQQAMRVSTATTALQLSPEVRASVAGRLRLVPVEKTARIAALGRRGSPIRRLATLTSSQGSVMVQEMIRGTAQGMSPRAVAGEAAKRLTSAADSDVLRVARTEMLRASRDTTAAWLDENSEIMEGGVWHAQLDEATCAVCWAMHGTPLEPGEPVGTHPNCRCANLPRPKSPAELGFTGIPDDRPLIEPGVDRFDRLDPAAQRGILGPEKHDAFMAGDIKLGDVVKLRDHPDWGPTRSVGSIDHALSSAS